MTLSKNLFFSEDEIEAVDMEIETLLLARKRQEYAQSHSTDNVTSTAVQPSEPKPVASRQAPETSSSPASFPAIRKSLSVLPPQRLTKTGDVKTQPTFRIDQPGDTLLWPEPELRSNRHRNTLQYGRSSSQRKWLIGSGGVIAVLAALLAAFLIWPS